MAVLDWASLSEINFRLTRRGFMNLQALITAFSITVCLRMATDDDTKQPIQVLLVDMILLKPFTLQILMFLESYCIQPVHTRKLVTIYARCKLVK